METSLRQLPAPNDIGTLEREDLTQVRVPYHDHDTGPEVLAAHCLQRIPCNPRRNSRLNSVLPAPILNSVEKRTATCLVAATIVASCFAPLVRAQAGGKHDETSTTSTTSPQSLQLQISPVRLYSTGNSQLAARAADGDLTTEFVTQMMTSSPPTWAWVNADLGENVPLVRIEWMWSAESSADQFRVDVSTDGVAWTTVAKQRESPVGKWNSLQLDAKAQIVRFAFQNPNHDPQLGHLAEVRFFARADFVRSDQPRAIGTAEIISRAEVSPRAAVGSTLKGRRYTVKGSARSSNSPEGSSRVTLDGKVDTAWQTAMTVPPRTGWTAYDLGDSVTLGELRWQFSTIEFADQFALQSSPDGVHWTTFAKASNALSANTWVTLTANVKTRFVRFLFSNPNKDASIGFLSEVRFYSA